MGKRSATYSYETKVAMAKFVEAYHNHSHPHSTIGWQIPAKLMDELFERTATTCDGLLVAA